MDERNVVGPRLELAAPQRAEPLTVFPLVTRQETELPYLLLADALEAGTLEITEVGSGSVPSLRAVNRGEEDVLVLDGEQLVGAKQNRMTNRALLLPAGSETKIPVSCMERGRWRDTGRTFRSAPQHSPGKVRRKARKLEARRVALGLEASPKALAGAQGEVWAEIRDQSASLGVDSPTEALDDLYTTRRRALSEWAERFPSVDGQVGLLAFLGAEALGLDVVGGRSHWARLHQRVLRGYLMDALGRGDVRRAASGAEGPGAPAAGGSSVGGPSAAGRGGDGGAEPDEADALRFLARVREADRAEAPTVGKGTYVVLSGGVLGAELTDGDLLAHRCAFPPEEDDDRGGVVYGRGPIAGPRTRRRP